MALSFLSVSGRPLASLISCLAAPQAPPPPNPNPTALPSLTCASSALTSNRVLVALKSTISTVRSSSTRPPTSSTNMAYLTSPSILVDSGDGGAAQNSQFGAHPPTLSLGSINRVRVLGCTAHHPNISAAVELLQQGIAKLNVEPYDEDQGTGELRYVQMAVTTYNTSLPYAERYRNGKVQVALVWHSRDENSPSSKKLNALANFLWRYGGPNRKVHLIHSVWANFQTSINNVSVKCVGFCVCAHVFTCWRGQPYTKYV